MVTLINGRAGLQISLCLILQTDLLEGKMDAVYKLQVNVVGTLHTLDISAVFPCLFSSFFYLSPRVTSVNYRQTVWRVCLSIPTAIIVLYAGCLIIDFLWF